MAERFIGNTELGLPMDWPIVPELLIARTVWAARRIVLERASPAVFLNRRLAVLVAEAVHDSTMANWPCWGCIPLELDGQADGIYPKAFEIESEGRSGD